MSRKLRILLLTTSFPVTPSSSSGIFVERLAQKLGRHCELTVLTPDGNTISKSLPDRTYNLVTFRYAPRSQQVLAHGGGGIPAALANTPWLKGLLPIFLGAMSIQCLRYAKNSDLIFANWSICGVIAGTIGRIYGIPVVTAIRGQDANKVQQSSIFRVLLASCIRLNHSLVGVSDDIASKMKQLFPKDAHKVTMIPNGVEVNDFISGREKNENLVLIFIGSLTRLKSTNTILEALKILPNSISLIILGDGPEKANLKIQADHLDISNRVSFVGHVSPDQVSLWLAKADVLVLPSTHEGRPNVVLEAMATGLPVVGSDIPGIRELVIPDETGFLFPVGKSASLAECLMRLRDPQLRERLGAKGYGLLAERGLTWENTAKIYMQHFNDIYSRGNF